MDDIFDGDLDPKDNPFSLKNFGKEAPKKAKPARRSKPEVAEDMPFPDDSGSAASAAPATTAENAKDNPFSFKAFVSEKQSSSGTGEPKRRDSHPGKSDDAQNPYSFKAFSQKGEPTRGPAPTAAGSSARMSAQVAADSSSSNDEEDEEEEKDEEAEVVPVEIDRRAKPSSSLSSMGSGSNSGGSGGGGGGSGGGGASTQGKSNGKKMSAAVPPPRPPAADTRPAVMGPAAPLVAMAGEESSSGSDSSGSEDGEGPVKPKAGKAKTGINVEDALQRRIAALSTQLSAITAERQSMEELHAVELSTLRSENTRLAAAAKEAEKKAAKLEQALKKRESSDRKEAEALEAMAARVEENLRQATARAVAAEAKAAQLQQQLDAARMHSSPHVKAQARAAAEHLSTAASNAEKALRTLFQGVNTLKLASDILQSIDSVSPAE